MIELIFSDSGAALLALAKETGDTSALSTAEITSDGEGNESIRMLAPKPYTGPRIPGDASEISSIWLMGDVGDIAAPSIWQARTALMEEIAALHEIEGEGWVPQASASTQAQVSRLQEAARSGEAIRIWYSDIPEELCGYYWVLHLLKDAAGEVFAIKVPRIWPQRDTVRVIGGTGQMQPEDFHACLSLERLISPETRKGIAMLWETLRRENAPLRAAVNGVLCSVPEEFYDAFLYQALPDGEFRVAQAIGHALGQGPDGVHDWWYARRIKALLARGELRMTEQADKFYYARVRKG